MKRVLFGVALLAVGCGGGLKSKLCGGLGEPCCEAEACNPGTRCGGGNTCQACGGLSQPCCLGDVACSGQAACTSDVCLPCGAVGQACCAGGTCTAAATCSGGSCVDTATCANPCDVGASRCSGGGIETCSAVGVCPTWRTTVIQCPSGTLCQAGGAGVECVETCPSACTPDALICTLEGLKRCVLGPTCPSLVVEPDDTDRPQCVTGAVVGTEIIWESPVPLHTPLAAIAGDFTNSYWVLDRLGNIVHNALGSWEYEVRATPGKRALALTSCNLGSRLVAGGQGGTIYRRGFGSWTEENVGNSSVTLKAVICDFDHTFAAGSDGKLYFKGTGGWASVTTGALGPINAMAYVSSQQRLYLMGNAGEIINCDIAGTPSCLVERSGTTSNLLAAWGDTYSGAVYAVGTSGTMLQRGGGWAPISVTDGPVTDTLYAVHGWHDLATNSTRLAAVGGSGVYVAAPGGDWYTNTVAPEELTGVMLINDRNIFASSSAGKIWYTDQVLPPPTVPFSTRGGTKPVAKSLNAITSAGPGRLIAVGDEGTRVRRENGAWLSDGVGVSTTEPLFAVASRGNAESYAVGGAGTILVRRYGIWADDAMGVTTKHLSGVAMDKETVWAVGNDGTWLEKKLAGGSWASIGQTATAEHLRAIAMRLDSAGKATELVAVGTNCTVLSKQGTTVTTQTIADCPPATALSAAVFTPSGELYVGGDDAVVYHRSTLGFQREYLGNTLETVNALVAQGSSVWALCNSGELYRRAGVTWVTYAADVTTTPLNGAVNDERDGLFFVGGRGLIWRRP